MSEDQKPSQVGPIVDASASHVDASASDVDASASDVDASAAETGATETAPKEELRTVNAELQRKVEQLLQATEDLDNLLRSTNIPTLFLDQELRLKRFTPPALSLFRFEATDVGRPIAELSLELQGMDLIGDSYSVLANPRPVTREVQSADGRLYLHRTQPYRTKDNAIKGVVATFVDITDLAQARAEFRVQADKLQTIMDVVPMTLLIAQDVESGRVTGNRTAYELLGLPPGANVPWLKPGGSDAPYQVMHDGQPIAPDQSPLTVAARTGKSVEGYEVDVVFADHVLTLLGNAAPLASEDGNTVGAVAAYLDITARKPAEQERSRMASAVEVSQDAIIVLDTDGTIITWNNGARQTYGYEAEQVIGQPYLSLIAAADQQVAQAALGKAYAGEIGVLDEVGRFRQDGKFVPVSAIFSPVRDAAGQVTEVSVIERDITRWQHAVGELRELHESMKQRAAQLQAAALQLTEAEHIERDRLAHVLHDGIQQVLASAKLKIQIAAATATGDLQTTLGEIQQALEGAIAESRDLTTQLSPPVSQEEPLADALQWLVGSMQERYQYEVHLQADPEADPRQQLAKVVLFEAARELLFNSVKHSGATEGNLTLALEGKDTVVLTVSDAGSGFAPSAAPAKTKGFGLFSVRERIELLGGSMEIESAPGQGATFRIRVPRRGPMESQTPDVST
jgi:PAS domain S-box-containing protein